MRIETERLVLRRPEPADADAVLEIVGDPRVVEWLGGGEVGDRATAAAVVERWIERWDGDGVGHFVVERRDDGRFVGRVGFLVWDPRVWESSTYADAGDSAETELGWAVVRSQWGNGYATEAALAARTWAYDEAGLERVMSLVAPQNVRSIRVVVKLGAQPERLIHTGHGAAIVWVHPR